MRYFVYDCFHYNKDYNVVRIFDNFLFVYDCFHYNKDYNEYQLSPDSSSKFMIFSITTRITTNYPLLNQLPRPVYD